MPFKSEAQRRWMYAAEARGDVPKGTAKKWQEHTRPPHLTKEAAALAQANAVQKYTGAKPLDPTKAPAAPGMDGASRQGLMDAIAQKSLDAGGEKLDNNLTLPVVR